MSTPNSGLTPHYSMLIQWSDADGQYIVRFPEWGDSTHTPSATYEEAVRHGGEVLADLVDRWVREERPIRDAPTFLYPDNEDGWRNRPQSNVKTTQAAATTEAPAQAG